MAEETPGNLGAQFGGWTAGRAVDDNRGIDRATDRLESEINRFADALERLTAGLGSAQSSTGGGQQTKYANGGQATFGGEPTHRAGERSTGQTSWGMASTGGAHAGDPPAGGFVSAMSRFGNGGSHNADPHRLAKGVAVGGLAAAATYTAGHYSNQMTGEALARMGAGSGNWSQAYMASVPGNYTAHSDKDRFATLSMMNQRSGYAMGTAGYNRLQSNVASFSAVSPAISNQQGMAASTALSSVSTFNRMARMGINPLGAAGRGDPRAVARQLLSKMNASRVKNVDQAMAAFAPNGSAVVTLDSYVAAGYLPPESRAVVESEMKNILLAQVRGVSAQEYTKLATTANSSTSAGADARAKLQSYGITTESGIQDARRKEGHARDSEAQTITGFVRGVEMATDTLTAFRKALNKVLSVPGVGESVGLFGGVTGTMPIIGSVLGRIPGGGMINGMMGGLGGDGPASMASGQMSYGGSSGAGRASAGFGSVSMRSGSTGSSQGVGSRYSLGAVKPWVAKAASILGPMFGISSIGGVAARSTPSDHPKGLALDFMCGKSQGDRLAAYAVANHRALNITYVIWRQRIWSINDRRWKMMEDRGDPTQNHMDHVHVSFLASPANGDFSNMPSGGVGGGKGNILAQGMSSPDNGSSSGFTAASGFNSSGQFSEVAALALQSSGAGGGGGLSGGSGSLRGSGVGAQGGGTGGGTLGRMSGFGSGAAGSVRTGTLNVGSLKGATNPTADVERLLGRADVLSLTETNPQRIAALRKGLADDNWGVYAGDGSAKGRYAQDASIVYDKSKYDLIKGGTYKLGDLTGNFLGGKGKRFANYALLRDKTTGMSFWQVSAHTVPMANADKAHRRMHTEQFNSLDELSEMLQRTGIPVIMGGDFNQQRNRDFWRDPSGMSSARGGGVDHVFGQAGMVKTSSLSMAGGMSGDHSGAVLTTMSIKGTGSSARSNGGSPAQNMALGRSMAAARGWTGPQWNALKQLWMRESGWRTDADNPTSSAYGIPQALTQLHGLGDQYMSDPKTQIQWGLNYIAGRYGDPSKAWNFWQKNNYYKQGAWRVREDKEAQIHQGEMLLPSKIADIVRDELVAPGVRNILGGKSPGGRGQVSIVFQADSIRVTLGGGANEEDARQAGKWIMDAVAEDARFKALAEGR